MRLSIVDIFGIVITQGSRLRPSLDSQDYLK